MVDVLDTHEPETGFWRKHGWKLVVAVLVLPAGYWVFGKYSRSLNYDQKAFVQALLTGDNAFAKECITQVPSHSNAYLDETLRNAKPKELCAGLFPSEVEKQLKPPYGTYRPLHLALLLNRDELVPLLLEKGADPNAKLRSGPCPLEMAIQLGKPEAFKALVAKGVNCTDVTLAKATPEMVRLLVQDAKLNVNGGRDQPHLMVAVLEGNEPTALALIELGADVNAKSSFGAQPLHIAAEKGLVKTVKALLDKGVDPNVKDSDGRTAAHRLADPHMPHSKEGQLEILKLLIAHKANLSIQDGRGESPVHASVRQQRKDIAKALVEGGADLKLRNKDGEAAMDMARRTGDMDLIAIVKYARRSIE